MNEAAKKQQQGSLGQRPPNKDWEKRIADRAELAKRAGAHVLIPTCGVTRIVLQITQQMDALYQQLTQQSGYFGKISNEKRMGIELQLAEHLVGMSLTAEKMAKTVGGRARYNHPRELERLLKAHAQVHRPAKSAETAKEKSEDQLVPAAEVSAKSAVVVPSRSAKKVVPVVPVNTAEPVAATA
jgi:hypothetical protein